MRLRLAATALGVVLVLTGTAFVYWPAACILAGVGLLALGLLTDDGSKA